MSDRSAFAVFGAEDFRVSIEEANFAELSNQLPPNSLPLLQRISARFLPLALKFEVIDIDHLHLDRIALAFTADALPFDNLVQGSTIAQSS